MEGRDLTNCANLARPSQANYLRNIVTAEIFKPDPEKVKAIKETPKLKAKQDFQRLLGMVNYLSQYIPNISEITAPLRSLLKKERTMGML